MASSNIKLFDENKGNMLSDSEFSISNQRMNGLQTGVASSQLQNKAMYQASLIAYAIAQVMMQNGKNANDTDAVSAFVANLSGTMLQKVYDIATTAEAEAGVTTGKWMSPALVKAAIDTLAAKAQNILSDATKAFYGLDSSAVPDDAFQRIGNMMAVIHVLAPAYATVTMSKGEKTVNATADSNGFADLHPFEYGEWEVTCNGTTKTILIDKASVYYMVMPSLDALSWSQISYISKNGLATTVFNIGDKKALTINGVSYDAVIIGFNHDTPTNTVAYGRDKAGITWQMKDCYSTVYQMDTAKNDNSVGWTNCYIRQDVMVTLLNQLDSNLRDVIVKVNKLSSAGGKSTTINTTEDSLFLLSEIEIFGSVTKSAPGEGSQYDYYNAGNSKKKGKQWWERSPVVSDSVSFCLVGSDGSATSSYMYYAGATKCAYGISFAFCI